MMSTIMYYKAEKTINHDILISPILEVGHPYIPKMEISADFALQSKKNLRKKRINLCDKSASFSHSPTIPLRKFQIICGFFHPANPTFGMYEVTSGADFMPNFEFHSLTLTTSNEEMLVHL